MLSRVAENVYWMSRYLERTEGSARLLVASSQLLFDLPRETPLSWGTLVDILGAGEDMAALEMEPTERDVAHFLIGEARFANSLVSVVRRARENARVSRDILPGELWERINALHHYVGDNLRSARGRSARHEFLQHVVQHCQQIEGAISGGLSRGTLYSFVALGQSIERADMTSRIVDVRSANLLPRDAPGPYANVGWMSVLQSLSGYEMYRQEMQARINGEPVVWFLLGSDRFPRAFRYCLNRIDRCLAHLPNAAEPRRYLAASLRRLAQSPLNPRDLDGVRGFIDLLQQDLITLDQVITTTYFRFDHAAWLPRQEAIATGRED